MAAPSCSGVQSIQAAVPTDRETGNFEKSSCATDHLPILDSRLRRSAQSDSGRTTYRDASGRLSGTAQSNGGNFLAPVPLIQPKK